MNGAIPADPWSLVGGAIPDGYRLAAPPDVAPVAPDPARPTARVLARAGAWPRDTADARVVESVRTRAGRHIDSQEEVGGWPAARVGPARSRRRRRRHARRLGSARTASIRPAPTAMATATATG